MSKVFNFLFPGDVIRLDYLFEPKYKAKLIVESVYILRNGEAYLIKLFNVLRDGTIDNLTYQIDIDLISSSIILTEFKFYKGALVKNNTRAIEFSIDKNIIKRNRYINKDDYCTEICSVKNICKGGDKNCEHGQRVNNKFKLLGDEVIITNSGKLCKVIGIVYTGSYRLIIDSLKDSRYYNEGNRDVDLVKKDSILITFNPCKLCILSNCDSCELKPLKDAYIL